MYSIPISTLFSISVYQSVCQHTSQYISILISMSVYDHLIVQHICFTITHKYPTTTNIMSLYQFISTYWQEIIRILVEVSLIAVLIRFKLFKDRSRQLLFSEAEIERLIRAFRPKPIIDMDVGNRMVYDYNKDNVRNSNNVSNSIGIDNNNVNNSNSSGNNVSNDNNNSIGRDSNVNSTTINNVSNTNVDSNDNISSTTDTTDTINNDTTIIINNDIINTITDTDTNPIINNDTTTNISNVIEMADYDILGIRNMFKDDVRDAIRRYGIGTCGPPLFYGTLDVHIALERTISRMLGVESSILYSNSHTCIESVIVCYCKKGDIVLYDRQCHEGILRGMYSSKADTVEIDMRDRDVCTVIARLRRANGSRRMFLVVEGLYRNTGRILDLPLAMHIRHTYHVHVIVDESLSIPMLGSTGISGYYGSTPRHIDVLVGSLAHVYAAGGAFVAGTATMVDYQRLLGPSYCFSASMPAFIAMFALCALSISVLNSSNGSNGNNGCIDSGCDGCIGNNINNNSNNSNNNQYININNNINNNNITTITNNNIGDVINRMIDGTGSTSIAISTSPIISTVKYIHRMYRSSTFMIISDIHSPVIVLVMRESARHALIERYTGQDNDTASSTMTSSAVDRTGSTAGMDRLLHEYDTHVHAHGTRMRTDGSDSAGCVSVYVQSRIEEMRRCNVRVGRVYGPEDGIRMCVKVDMTEREKEYVVMCMNSIIQ